MNVLLLSPGYPAEMPLFTRALARAGARVFGLGDQPEAALPKEVRAALASHVHVRSLWHEDAVVEFVCRLPGAHKIERVECLWEPYMLLAAKLREALGVPGATVRETLPFRDKEVMKQALDAAGLRTPRHVRARTMAACWEAAEALGFPLILKPIAGAGSADTYRVNHADELRAILPRLRHVPEVSVEEFIDGEEYTFDTITVGGQIAYHNIAWYRPRPLVARSNEWISPQVVALRQVDQPVLHEGAALGQAVIEALGVDTSFTHMEWYRKSDGEVVFGEIGLRPPGAHQVDQMNYACDVDVYLEWARAVTGQAVSGPVERKYNVATVYKRAVGSGRIRRIEGWSRIQAAYGAHIVWNTLLPVGAMRRNWRQTLVSDGFLMLRHPDLERTLAMADDIGQNLHLYAGE
jgi:formate-dependent phosphoribosylglycinamide formyltransferase (GAR transformylase)